MFTLQLVLLNKNSLWLLICQVECKDAVAALCLNHNFYSVGLCTHKACLCMNRQRGKHHETYLKQAIN